MVPSYIPWKQQNIFDFLVFSVGIKWKHLPEMSEGKMHVVYVSSIFNVKKTVKTHFQLLGTAH